MSIYSKVLLFYRTLDLAWVFLVVNSLWKIRPKAMHTTIRQFSTIEADTSKQLYLVYQLCVSRPAQRMVLSQILDEINHAHIFKKISVNEYSNFFEYSPEQKRLTSSLSDAVYLILYCHVGETEAAIRLRNISLCIRDKKVKSAIQQVLDDEEGHVTTTKKVLLLISPDYNLDLFERDCLRIFFQRRGNVLKRILQDILVAFVKLFLVIIYYSFGLFLFLLCRKRMLSSHKPSHSLEINTI